jgi:predicted HTH transcriptional regulator
MSSEEYRPIIFAQREDRNREFKQSFPWIRSSHGNTMAKVTKTILAMSNLRDGGHIVIGVEEDPSGGGTYTPVGMQNNHLSSFSYENMADFVRAYAEPYVRFDIDVVDLNGKAFLVIAVAGFGGTPVICKKSYGNVLSEGTIYVRSRSGRPRSEPVSNYADMRELIDLAVESGVREFLETQSRISRSMPNDQELFDQQMGDF